MKQVILKFLPPGSRRRQLAVRLKQSVKSKPVGQPFGYRDWIEGCEPAIWENLKAEASLSPLISIVVPVYNAPDKYFGPLIESLISQTYPKWQLCIADASDDSEKSANIEKRCQADERIVYKKLDKNYGISQNTNHAIKMAKGSFIGFLDHDDTLSPHAIEEVVIALNENPKSDLFYSDEDKLSDDGSQRLLPFFKPGWSPDLLLGVNYITHFVVARKSLIRQADGLRTGFDGAQDYDFLLRLTEKTDRITHIQKILYHWRQAAGSTSVVVTRKNYADTAGQRALREAVQRRRIKAEVVEIPERPTNYRLRYLLPKKPPLVSIIIPFKDKPELLKQCLDSISSKTTYEHYEIILISNNSEEPKTASYLKSLKDKKIKQYEWNKPFNYAALNNYGRKQAAGEYLILLNNDTQVITPEWIEELIGVASQPGVGAVGPLLYYPDRTIQHAGVILGLRGMAGHVFRNRKPGEWTDFGLAVWPRDYLAVTGACLAIKAKRYDSAGGLDEKFIMAGNDVALGISLHQKGYRNIYWPFAQLIHHENQTVISYQNAPKSDYDHSLKYYRPYLEWRDPFFNRNLDLMNEQIGLRRNYDN